MADLAVRVVGVAGGVSDACRHDETTHVNSLSLGPTGFWTRENETLKDLQVLTVTPGYLNYKREDTTADDNNTEEQPAWAVALFFFERATATEHSDPPGDPPSLDLTPRRPDHP